MRPQRTHRVRLLLAASVAMFVLSACAQPGTPSTASAPTATTSSLPSATATFALPGAPAGWSVYHNNGFAVAYPNDAGLAESTHHPSVAFYNARLTIMQVAGDQSLCALATGESWAPLAGLTMKYSTPQGVHRVWFFLDSAGNGYQIEADDGFPTSTSQDVQQDNAILATLKLDNSTPGCAQWGA